MSSDSTFANLIDVYGADIQKYSDRNPMSVHGVFSPGRVNLIGEYTDFNGGRVLPFAIPLGTYLIAVENNEGRFSFQSTNFDERVELDLNELRLVESKREDFAWANYPLGVLKQFLSFWKGNRGVDFFLG